MTREEAINILEQYREKPTLINEIETVEEAVWLDEALEVAIKALEQEPILDKIRAEIKALPTNYIEVQRPHSVVKRDVVELGLVMQIIDKYKAESEGEND